MIHVNTLLKKQILLSAFSFVLGLSLLSAQTVVTSGTTMKVVTGTTVTEASGDGITLAGTIDNQGTINLKGNLTNNGTASLGNGTFVFNGTTGQTITGVNTFNNLTVNNAAGVTLAGNTRVDGALTLTSGRITLGNYNLTMGPSAPAVAGTPSANNMIVATGTGELRKEYSATGSFVFPVGDNSGTAEYSPVTIDFSAGTFGAGAYAGVNLVDDVYPDPAITGDYLTRYWNLTSSGITGFTSQATFNYVDTDIQGTEANIHTVKINPAPVVTYDPAATASNALVAPGLTSFSSFTGMHGVQSSNLFAWLEGPFNTTSNNMNLTLNSIIPLTQPYNTAPWNYAGTESVATMPADAVDWVLVTLRVGASPLTAVDKGTVAAILKSDGSIVSASGGALQFYNVSVGAGENVYPVIRHRNHLGIMANTGATKANGIYAYDFRSSLSNYPGDGSGIKLLKTGYYGLYAGDANGDGTIQTGDKGAWVSFFNQTGYLVGGADFNLDGDVQTSDKGKWVANFNIDTTIP